MHSTSDEPYKYLYRALTILYRTLDLIWNGLLDYYTVHSNVKMNENFFFFFSASITTVYIQYLFASYFLSLL